MLLNTLKIENLKNHLRLGFIVFFLGGGLMPILLFFLDDIMPNRWIGRGLLPFAFSKPPTIKLFKGVFKKVYAMKPETVAKLKANIKHKCTCIP